MSARAQIAVIGAGPAGLAAATLAAKAGASTVLIDEQCAPGGQIYRGVTRAPARLMAALGDDYAEGLKLCHAAGAAKIEHLNAATVFELTHDREVYFTRHGQAHVLEADAVIVAAGALERPMPFPGWTLPGVMTAGAAQIALKTAGLVPGDRTVLAGSGPLLYLLAAQLLNSGGRVAALVDTTPVANWRTAVVHLPRALAASRYLRKGLGLLHTIRRHGVVRYRHAHSLIARGGERVRRLGFKAGGREHELACDLLVVHCGVTPNTQLTRSLDLIHHFDTRSRSFNPRVDAWGETALERILVAGDGAAIGGATAAAHRGQLAALGALESLGLADRPTRDTQALPIRRALARDLRVRPFLDALYAPPPEFLRPVDDAFVCRCEEVTAGQIREFVRMGCVGPNQTKAFGRPGMGPCQGRLCGLTVSEIIASERKVPVEDVGYYRIRPPIKPVTLGELAAMPVAREKATGRR
ncbi:MAG: FAD-dependent oxidoreductase [Gammaproteobacteria bacterium]